MITIRNISDSLQSAGEHLYLIRINYKKIGTFRHRREQPLHVLLQKASEVAEEYEKMFPWNRGGAKNEQL